MPGNREEELSTSNVELLTQQQLLHWDSSPSWPFLHVLGCKLGWGWDSAAIIPGVQPLLGSYCVLRQPQPPRKDDSIWNLCGAVSGSHQQAGPSSLLLCSALKCVSQESSWPLCGTARAGNTGSGGSGPSVCLGPCSELWGCHLQLGSFPEQFAVASSAVLSVRWVVMLRGAETPTSSSSIPGMSQVFWRQGRSSSAAIACQDEICSCFLHLIFLSAPFATLP